MLEPQLIPPTSPPIATLPGLRSIDDGRALADVGALLDRARLRQRRIVLASTALRCSAGLVLALPALLLLAASGSALARPLAGLALFLSVAGFGWFGVVRARREVGDAKATARLLALRLDSPALRRGLLVAWELGEEMACAPGVDFSPALAAAHIESVALVARRARLETALPDAPVRAATYGLLLAAALLVLGALIWRDPMSRGAHLLFLSAREGAAAKPIAEPVTGEIELTFVYPAYTRLPTRTVPNTNGEISAPKGTEVKFRTRADRELSQAFVVVGGNALPVQAHGRDLAGTLLVASPGSYRFRFMDRLGRTLVEGPPIPIAVEADAAPKVSLLAPMADIEVDPRSHVTLRYEAQDDFGISELALLFKLPGAAKPQRLVLQRAAEAPRRATGDYSWDLVAPGLMPGDVVTYYLEATDNDEVSGKKTGVSRTQRLKIYSEAEHHRKIVQQIQRSWEKLLTLLADRLEGPDHRPVNRTDEAVLGQSAVDARTLELAQELTELTRTLRKEKAPEPLWRALAHVAAGLTEKASATVNARAALAVWLRKGATLESETAHRLWRAVDQEIAEEERDILYLEALVDQQRVADLAELSKELSAQRRELAGLLEKFRTAPDDASRAKITQEVARLKERMAELMQRIAELSKSINDEHINEEALREASQAQEALSGFDKIQELLNQGKVEEAMKELEKIGQALDQLEQNLAKAAHGGEKGEQPFGELGKQLGEFARDLDKLEQDQKGLLEETQKIRENYKKALEDRLQQKGADFLDKLRKKADESRKKLAAMKNVRGFWREDDLKRAKENVEDLDKALAVKDFDQAAESAAKALMHAQSVADEFERAAQDARRFPPEFKEQAQEAAKNSQQAKGAVPPLEEIKKALESLTPPPAAAMTEEDRQKMKGLSQRQGDLQSQAGQLQKKMEQLNQQAPLFPQGAQQMMRQAGQRMGQAKGQMDAKNPTGSAAEERAALDQLGEVKKGLEKNQGQGQGSGSPMPWPWMGQSTLPGQDEGMGDPDQTKVEIPDPDKYLVPVEYRKDILDAMKQGTPEKYKDQVKRYYEEIVK